MPKIRLLIVDDSALIRQVLTQIFAETSDIEVVGVAADPYIAREKIKQLNPDVLTLDVEMPKMDGVTFLGNLMRLRPMPVVMVSTLTEQGADVTLRALEYGAVDFVAKPKVDVAESLKDYAAEIIGKVRMAAKAKVKPLEKRAVKASKPAMAPGAKHSADVILKAGTGGGHFRTTDKIIGIGSSTGGTEAVKDVLAMLPMDIQAGIVISQHIPAAFSGPFAKRANSVTPLTVCEAADGQQILPGHVYIAPGDRHLLVQRDGARYVCRLNDGPPVNRHRPSVDVMIRSLAQNAGPNAIGVMLTGMGDDGAAGMGELKECGAPILVQDEKTSVVWGMPGEVAKRGFADEILPLNKIGPRLIELIKK
ncbi:protein-glutamate methylesterase/protein-glutamine glutaminase [Thiosocius teredinicola]|uniref:protein-glutamate methylesterase/protein-glutamine glutaminase n=1 Tax=Thiosocius teredinicola TaxID=1973002 RepID=UPI0009911E5A